MKTKKQHSVAMQQLIAIFADELATLIRQETLEEFRSALGVAPDVRVVRLRPKQGKNPHKARYDAPGARVKGEKRSPVELGRQTEQLRAFIVKKPGLRVEAIAEALKVSTRELVLPLTRLLSSGAIRKKGERRGTSYYPATKGAP